MPDLRQRWGANLKKARNRAGLTQVEAAAHLRVSQQTIVEWEKGRTAPTPENQVEIVALYKIDARKLFPLDKVEA